MPVLPSGGNPAQPGAVRNEPGTPQTPPVSSPPSSGGRGASPQAKRGNILLISRYGELLPLAERIGAKVWYCDDWYRERGLGEGMVEFVGALKDGLKTASAVICDHTGDKKTKVGPLMDALRAREFPCWGGGEINDLLETNRAFGISVMQKAGISVPRTLFFSDRGDPWQSVELGNRKRTFVVNGHLNEAAEFVQANGGRWVFKPYDMSSDLTYVSKDAEDMVSFLRHTLEHDGLDPHVKFLLQEHIKGVEVSTEGWGLQGELIPPFSGTLEIKRAWPGDLGPATGCQTSTVWLYGSPDTKLVKQTIGREEMRAWLKAPTGPGGKPYPPYNGPLDINCIVSEEDHKPYGIEWTPRFGYSAVFALLELLDADMVQALIHLANGKMPTLPNKPGYAYCLKVSIPPAPGLGGLDPSQDDREKAELDRQTMDRMLDETAHTRIGGPIDSRHVWLTDAQKVNGGYRTAGTSAEVMEITGSGKTIEEAERSVCDLFEEIDLSEKWSRCVDGAQRAKRDSLKLQEWGFEIPND